jgi:diacylglycerol kinase family enzyme
MARGRNLGAAVKYAAASLARSLPLVSGVKTYKGKRVVIRPEEDEEVPVQIDGDPGGRLPMEAEIIPGALAVLVL